MSTWQPIETAPKDGTVILGFDDQLVAEMNWSDEWRFGEAGWKLSELMRPDESIDVSPTHWMPLPEPPK